MTGIYKKLESEIRTLFSLSVINLILAALTMGIGVSIAVNMATAGWESMGFLALIFPVIVAGLFMALGIKWILSVMDVFEGIESVKEEYDEKKKDPSVNTVTSVIVNLMAVYRAKKDNIEEMNKRSKIAGVLFVFGGFVQALAFLVTGVGSGFDLLTVLTGVVGLVAIFGIGIACLLTPKYYEKHSIEWDKRLAKSDAAQKELAKKLASAEENGLGGGL